jgi:hypothetical protein
MITCCKHYQSCDIIKKRYSEDIEVAVIEYMPVPFDENINAKDYILSNIHNLNLLIKNVSKKVEVIVFPEYGLTSTEIIRSDLIPR